MRASSASVMVTLGGRLSIQLMQHWHWRGPSYRSWTSFARSSATSEASSSMRMASASLSMMEKVSSSSDERSASYGSRGKAMLSRFSSCSSCSFVFFFGIYAQHLIEAPSVWAIDGILW